MKILPAAVVIATLRPILRPGVHRLFHRKADEACVLCRSVWWLLLRDPQFRASAGEGLVDFAAGRTVHYHVDDLQ